MPPDGARYENVKDADTRYGASHDLSVVAGGPSYRAMLRLRLASAENPLLARRVGFFLGLTWLPPLVLAIVGGHAIGGQITVPFLKDFVAGARFLLALPLLIVAEPLAGVMLQGVAKQFLAARVVAGEEVAGFARAVSLVSRLRDSRAAEAVFLGIAYLGAYVNVGIQLSISASSWRVAGQGGLGHLTAAGWWYVLVSIPIFQFLLYRWAWRFALWTLFVWRLSRLKLQLNAAHPDHTAGLAFLAGGATAFAPVVFALSIVFSAAVAGRAIYEGASLSQHTGIIGAFLILAVLVPFLSTLSFVPKLLRVRWRAAMEYGALGTAVAEGFNQKWVEGRAEDAEGFLGTGDVQSLADLSSVVENVRSMRVIPVGVQNVLGLLVAAVVPMIPLLFLVYSAKDLLTMLAEFLF